MKGGLGGNFEDGGIGGGGRNPHRGGGGGGGFALDRSKVRILLCDSDAKSSKEVFQLLCNCSYQVTSVRTARQVIDVLGAQGPEIDIILAEVDLPIAKGFKMLKYITRNQELRRIPIIMMSAQDEVSVVVKCLRLGAADYLVKPLRTNELLNLWTHMWRRRRMLGLAEKDILNPDFELVLSDPSDANTNSTTLLSDDTDDKPRSAIQFDLTMSDHREYESNTYAMEPVHNNMLEKEPNILEDGDCARIFSRPKKTNLKVGESSAFLTYVKSSAPTSSDHQIDGNASLSEHLNDEVNLPVGGDIERCNSRGKQDSYAHGSVYGAGENVGRMYSYLTQAEFPVAYLSSSNMQQQQSRADGQAKVSGVHSIFPFPIYFPGIMNQNMIPPSMQMCQGDDMQVHNTPGALPQYNILPHCAHVPVMPTFPYHPVGINMQSGHMPAPHLWPSMTSSSTPETSSGPSGRTQRREAALIKFRQKRKDRCFDKKIRYVNRKKLAERRPRVRGQFVRQVNGVHIHPNDSPAVDADSEEDDDEEHVPRELDCGSSPERDVSDC